MADAPLLIYAQDLPSKDPVDFVQTKAEGIAEQVVNILLSQTGETK
jgi:hypothetical protein